MASPVTIHSTDEDLIQVDENGRGEKTFTVTNITGGSIRIGLQCQFENTEQKDWARPRGDVERDLGDQGSDRGIVDFTFQEDAAPGKYVFTLLAYSTKAPNLDFTVSEKVFYRGSRTKTRGTKKAIPLVDSYYCSCFSTAYRRRAHRGFLARQSNNGARCHRPNRREGQENHRGSRAGSWKQRYGECD